MSPAPDDASAGAETPRRRSLVPRLLYLAIGLALFAAVLAAVDLGAVWRAIVAFGLLGLAAIVAIYAVEFVFDTLGWQLAVEGASLSPRWLGRLLLARAVGEAFNTVTPLGGMGGEPVKALILKRRHGVGYRASAASLVIAKTVNLVSLVAFLAIGFVLVLDDSRLTPGYRALAGTGLAVLAGAAAAFFAFQRLELSSRLGRRLGSTPVLARLAGAIHHVEDVDRRLVDFYARTRWRFLAALAFGFGNWVVGAFGTWVTMDLLGTPVGFADAWIIESVAQMVRAGLFFIPASIGAQEGAFVVICGALTGNPTVGLAASLVRRFRELLWIAGGLALGYRYAGGVLSAAR